jgi:hypothetical protein
MQRDMGTGLDVWPRPELLPSVAELNAQFIELLVFQSTNLSGSWPLPNELRPLLASLEPAARRRAAACPYLLVDAGFSDAQRWLWAHGYAVCDSQPVVEPSITNIPRGIVLARQVFAYAWHLARSQRAAARVVLGMSQATADVISNYTLVQTMGLADVHPHWLQPRWPRHTRMWRDLVEAAAADDGNVLEQARLRGVQLLAAEARSSALP